MNHPMNDPITVGKFLRVCGILVGLVVGIGGGILFLDGSLPDSPSDEDKQNAKNGCITGIVGLVIIVLAVLLTACSTPAVKTVTVEVDKPVPVHVVKPADLPAPPPPLGPRPESLQAIADLALAGHCRDVSYIQKTFPMLLAAAGLPPAQAPDYPECDKH